MKHAILFISILFLVFSEAIAQKPVFRIEEDQMILRLEKQWNSKTIDSVLTLYDMQKLSVDTAWRFGSAGRLVSEGWLVRKKGKNEIEVYKSNRASNNIDLIGIPLCIDLRGTPDDSTHARNVFVGDVFGKNDFRNTSVTEINDSVTQFLLRGYRNAKQVLLSGTFNDWSTSDLQMKEHEEGWSVFVRIIPGRHEYKFIVDGQWMRDPDNNQKIEDNAGDYNSVYFKTNYTFTLPGYAQVRKVVLAGSFNDWNENDFRMDFIGNRWVIDVYLPNGTYTYKFIAGNEWITDPTNTDTRPDGAGNFNSFLSIGRAVSFILKGHADAHQVLLTGTFNNWATSGLVMSRTASGWELPVVIKPGLHEYKFIADGKWIIDESKPSVSSEIPGERNNYLIHEANHTFILKGFAEVSEVFVTGSFCGWREPGFKLYRSGKDWILPFYLPAGKHTYKFIADKTWIIDPGNNAWEDNEFGTGNSVVWMK